MIPDKILNKSYKPVSINEKILNALFKKVEKFYPQEVLNEGLDLQADHHKIKVKKAVRRPIHEYDEGDRIIYQRIIGRYEMPQSHRWIEDRVSNCNVSRKLNYCILIWNKKLASQ